MPIILNYTFDFSSGSIIVEFEVELRSDVSNIPTSTVEILQKIREAMLARSRDNSTALLGNFQINVGSLDVFAGEYSGNLLEIVIFTQHKMINDRLRITGSCIEIQYK